MEADRVQLYQDHRQQWRWRKIAPNGRIVLASTQGYDRREDCVANIEREVLTGWRVIIEEE